MHIAQVGFVKGRNVVSTVARNTSCNSGWLRLVVQSIFGTLIVSSFILIMLMVVGKPSRSTTSSSRCTVTNCRVTCENAPYYGEYEEDIINAASEADIHCKSIILKLVGPTFKNFQIPQSWLWSMSSNVRELSIVGGNIKQISPDAFMSPFGGNIKVLILEEIEISVWEKDMLLGLSNLEKLLLRDCILSDIRKDALAPVDDSLKFLDIQANDVWDPVNVTGTTKLLELSVVDFSSNVFRNNLGNLSKFHEIPCIPETDTRKRDRGLGEIPIRFYLSGEIKIHAGILGNYEADIHCKSIILKLVGPTFKNFQIPQSWLWSMSSNVRELSIVGGNIKQISPDAFMSPFGGNIKVLILEEIEISVWEKDMLLGLSNLEKLLLRDCILSDIRKDALAPVDDSLKFLDIQANDVWDPVNVTGTTKLLELSVVDFSSNVFRNNLGNGSFFKLRACKILYLNSCQIISLGPGTFDYLENIEILYLNENFIVTIPIGLFDRILPRDPRIALQDNLWDCNCSREDLRNIAREELLIVDPICHSPLAVDGMTFSDFEGYCKTKYDNGAENSDQRGILKSNPSVNNTSKIIYMNGACHGNISTKNNHVEHTLRVIANSDHQNCLLNRINRQDISSVSDNNDNRLVSTSGSWIKPVFLVRNNPYSMVEIISSALPGYGLLWYQSSCEDVVYCVNTVPRLLKVFNVDLGNYFTFCPFNLSSGTVRSTHCVSYNLENVNKNNNFTFKSYELIWFIGLSLGCLMSGAICVYGVIQRNPTLLKGSKRVLFVKHRSVEALILPPKLPLRKFDKETSITTRHIYEEKKIFVLPYRQGTLTGQNFARSFSMKSNESNDVSYISALQPTDEQLTEWRSNQILKQFDEIPSNISMIPYTSIYERESLPYYSLNDDDRVYEVPKQF